MALLYDDIETPEDTINEFTSPEGRKPILYYRKGGLERTMGILNMKLNLKPSGEASYSLSLSSSSSYASDYKIETYFDDYHINNIQLDPVSSYRNSLSLGDNNDVVIVTVTPASHTYLAWDIPIKLKVFCNFV